MKVLFDTWHWCPPRIALIRSWLTASKDQDQNATVGTIIKSLKVSELDLLFKVV